MSPRPSLKPDERKSYSSKEISDFAKNLQARRLELNLKQEDVANMIGSRKGQISRYEAGVFPTTPERIIALADALDVTIDWLFRNEPDAK